MRVSLERLTYFIVSVSLERLTYVDFKVSLERLTYVTLGRVEEDFKKAIPKYIAELQKSALIATVPQILF